MSYELEQKYRQLLLAVDSNAVSKKYAHESRHDTALRFIKERVQQEKEDQARKTINKDERFDWHSIYKNMAKSYLSPLSSDDDKFLIGHMYSNERFIMSAKTVEIAKHKCWASKYGREKQVAITKLSVWPHKKEIK